MKHYTTEELQRMREEFVKHYSNPSRIMVCCPTYAASAAKAPGVLQGLADQVYPNLAFVFLDTTPATNGASYAQLPALLEHYLPGKDSTILRTSTPAGASAHQIVAEAREQLRHYFLHSDATHLFFVDDDVVLPPDALATLYSHQEPAMVGVYLNPMILRKNESREVAPCVWVNLPTEAGLSPQLARPLLIIEVMPARTIRVVISGFGCSLFTRIVMDGSGFVFDPSSTATEDTPFFLDLERRGIPVCCDTRIKCWHLKFPYRDARNKFFDFDHYHLRFVP